MKSDETMTASAAFCFDSFCSYSGKSFCSNSIILFNAHPLKRAASAAIPHSKSECLGMKASAAFINIVNVYLLKRAASAAIPHSKSDYSGMKASAAFILCLEIQFYCFQTMKCKDTTKTLTD